MNLKKFISGVSALTVAASAFAGITAFAATEEVYLNEDYSSYAGETAIAALGTDYTWGNITYRANGRSGNWAGTAAFESNALKLTITRFSNSDRGAVLTFTNDAAIPSVADLDDDAILRLSFDLKAGNGAFVVSGFGTLTATDLGTNANTFSNVVIDLNKATGKQTVSVDGTIISLNDLSASTFTGFSFTDTTDTSSSANVTMWLDNIKVEQVEYVQSSVLVESSIQAKCGNTVLSESAITGYAGDTYTYSPYAYIEKDGVYYKYDSIGSNGEVAQVAGTFAEGMDPVVVSYTVASDVVAYAEVNVGNRDGGHGAFAASAANDNASGGYDAGTVYGQSGANCIQTFSVPVKGKYAITVNAVGTSSGSRTVYLDVDTEETTDTTNVLGTLVCNNGATAKTTVEVDLEAGDHTFYYLSNGSISPKLDYMVVELVEEYAPELGATVSAQGTENGTEEYANDSASWFVVTVSNTGDAEGSFTEVAVTEGETTYQHTFGAAVTLEATGTIVYGGIIDGVHSFDTAASVK